MVYPALLPLIRTPRLPVVDWTDAPSRFKWNSSVSPKDEIRFLLVCHYISNAVYCSSTRHWISVYRNTYVCWYVRSIEPEEGNVWEERNGEERRGENHVECLQDLMLCSSVNGYPPSVPHITVRLEFPWKSYSLFSYSFVAKLLWFENFPLWEVTSLFTDKYCMVATFLHPNRLVILGHFPPE